MTESRYWSAVAAVVAALVLSACGPRNVVTCQAVIEGKTRSQLFSNVAEGKAETVCQRWADAHTATGHPTVLLGWRHE